MVKRLLKDFAAIIGYILGVVGTIVTISVLPGSISVQINKVIFAVVLLIAAITLALLATYRYLKITKNGTRYQITAYSEEQGKDIYYTDFSKNLRYGTLVAVYYNKPISKKLGYGIIRNSSVDEYIEIEIIHIQDDLKTIFEQSKTNSHKVLEDMYVLPNVYVEDFDKISSYLSGEVAK